MQRMLGSIGILVALLAPSLALAAADDVNLDTAVVLNVGGIMVNVSGAAAAVESITVNAADFSFNLQSGSSIQVTAPGGNILATDTSADIAANTCNYVQSVLKYVGTEARTVTVTPNTTLCSSTGGNLSSTPATPATPAASTTTPTVPATPAIPASPSSAGLSNEQITSILTVLASFDADAVTIERVRAALQGSTAVGSVTSAAVRVFKSTLTVGSLGEEVRALQRFLNAHGYTVASSGSGSSGNETTKFGPLTRAAVIKYQKAKGITPAVGYFGAKTRAAVNSEQ